MKSHPTWISRVVTAIVLCAGLAGRSAAGGEEGVWLPLGDGVEGTVLAATVYNGELIVGGDFFVAGGVPMNHIARWNGSSWQPLGSGMSHPVRALMVHEGELIAGGDFSLAGDVRANGIARWDGSAWQPLGSGLDVFTFGGGVRALAKFNGELIAGGGFLVLDGGPGGNVARWDGSTWQQLDFGINNTVHALRVYEGELIAGFSRGEAVGLPNSCIARWDGSTWGLVGEAVGGIPADGAVYALAEHEGDLIAAGAKWLTPQTYVMRLVTDHEGTYWEQMGSWADGSGVHALTMFNGELIKGGDFTTVWGQPFDHVARWGLNEMSVPTWQPMGSGVNGPVFVLTEYNGDLIAAGNFTAAGGLPAGNIAKWVKAFGGAPSLTLTADDTCIDIDDVVTVSLVLNNTGGTAAAGYQAFLEFDDSSLEYIGGAYTASPFGLTLLDPIPVIDGEINLAAGIDPETQSPFAGSATLATLQFKRFNDHCEGSPIAFRSYILPTQLTAPGGAAIPDPVLEESEAIVVDGTPPSWTFLPSNIEVLSNQEDCSALVPVAPATAADECGDVTISGLRSDALALGAPYPPGLTTITWTATDACGNVITHEQTVHVLMASEVTLTVVLVGVYEPVTRCILFIPDTCDAAINVELDFIDHDADRLTPVRATTSIALPCGEWTQLCAKDEQHTLWERTSLSMLGGSYVADQALVLKAGDTDNDGDADINDVTWLLAQYGEPAVAGGCAWNGTRDADFSNDGIVGYEDYVLLSEHWLLQSGCACTDEMTEAAGSRRETFIPVSRLDPKIARKVDLNRDGLFDHRDVRLFEQARGLPQRLSRAIFVTEVMNRAR